MKHPIAPPERGKGAVSRARLRAATVKDRYRNRDFRTRIIGFRKSLKAFPLNADRRPQAWGADMTTAIAAHEPIEKYISHTHDDVAWAVARVNATAWQGEIVLAELRPRWRPTEEEVVRAAITVIFVALMAVIGVAAVAILTMG
ncbi:hypothetical protein [Mycobacterium sp. E2989]|uniref:hypothetical protein n=1 Tax=Mycobacterium sp. E2989 TaxID=1834140 RepID=UPI001E4C872B|nr:hypothetical protein [Mycobacterium sp. E2989]